METHTQREDDPLRIEAEVAVRLPQAKGHWRLPANHPKPGDRPGTDPSLEPSEGTHPAHTLVSDFWSEGGTFLCCLG